MNEWRWNAVNCRMWSGSTQACGARNCTSGGAREAMIRVLLQGRLRARGRVDVVPALWFGSRDQGWDHPTPEVSDSAVAIAIGASRGARRAHAQVVPFRTTS